MKNKLEKTIFDVPIKRIIRDTAITLGSIGLMIYGYQPKEEKTNFLPYQGCYCSGDGIKIVFDEYKKEERTLPAKIDEYGNPKTKDTKKSLELYKTYQIKEITPNFKIFPKRIEITEIKK